MFNHKRFFGSMKNLKLDSVCLLTIYLLNWKLQQIRISIWHSGWTFNTDLIDDTIHITNFCCSNKRKFLFFYFKIHFDITQCFWFPTDWLKLDCFSSNFDQSNLAMKQFAMSFFVIIIGSSAELLILASFCLSLRYLTIYDLIFTVW